MQRGASACARWGQCNVRAAAADEAEEQHSCRQTFDDRACITVMLEAMDILKKSKLDCQVIFCATVQEECGGGGARASVWNAKPDMAIAMDVCHAPTPGIKPFDAIDITKVSITCGPNIHPKMFK